MGLTLKLDDPQPSPQSLFQLVFRALTGKIMHDRGVPGFANGTKTPDADTFLERVAAHYNEPEPTAIQDHRIRQAVLDRLWSGVDLRNISVETLAYVWENTLLTNRDRRSKGIHATPPAVARYIIRRLPITEETALQGEVVEPCAVVHQLRCVPRGNYQLFNGKHSEHKVWAPRKVKGWKLHEQVAAKGQVGYIGGRRLKGSFVLKDLITGKTILEVVPSKLRRIARCTHGWIAATMQFNE